MLLKKRVFAKGFNKVVPGLSIQGNDQVLEDSSELRPTAAAVRHRKEDQTTRGRVDILVNIVVLGNDQGLFNDQAA